MKIKSTRFSTKSKIIKNPKLIKQLNFTNNHNAKTEVFSHTIYNYLLTFCEKLIGAQTNMYRDKVRENRERSAVC